MPAGVNPQAGAAREEVRQARMNLAHSLGCQWGTRPGSHMQACPNPRPPCTVVHCCNLYATRKLNLRTNWGLKAHGVHRRLAHPLPAARAFRRILGRSHAGAARCPWRCARRWRRRRLRWRSGCGCTTWRRSQARGARTRGKGAGMVLARCGSPLTALVVVLSWRACLGVMAHATH